MKSIAYLALAAALVLSAIGCGETRTGPQEVTPEARQQQKEEEQKVRQGEEAHQKQQRAVNGP